MATISAKRGHCFDRLPTKKAPMATFWRKVATVLAGRRQRGRTGQSRLVRLTYHDANDGEKEI